MNIEQTDSMEKAKEYAEKYNVNENDLKNEESDLEKVIQITVNENGLPNVGFNNLSVSEVIGLLNLALTTMQYETIGKLTIQKHLYNMSMNIK